AADLGQRRGRLRLARLEQLDDTGQTVRDVRAGDAAGVERPHGQLRAGLTDRLRRDRADRVAVLAHLPGGHRPAVAEPADTVVGSALEHRPHRHHDARVVARGLGEVAELRAVDVLALAPL